MTLAPILIVVLVAAVVVHARTLRRLSTDRSAMLFVVAAGCILVARPKLPTDTARQVGIWRGMDLVLYPFVLFSVLRLFSHDAGMRKLDEGLTREVCGAGLQNASPASNAAHQTAAALGEPIP
ncbi:MAG: DUF2304 domain-containing protein [Actinomycetes bacterium]